MRRILSSFFAAFLMAACIAGPARAGTETGEAYIYPTFSELTQAAVMLGAFDLSDSNVLREYVRLMYCNIYEKNYRDDFAWNKLEKQIRARIDAKKEYYRTLYQVASDITLGPYDFKEQRFPLVEHSDFRNVGYMALFSSRDFKPYCEIDDTEMHQRIDHAFRFPTDINIALSEPFTLTAIKASQAEAQKMLALMAKAGGASARKLYVRFRFRVQSAVPADMRQGFSSKTDFNGEIVSIDLFYDKEMTKWAMNLPVSG
jgi:hypothetical protein